MEFWDIVVKYVLPILSFLGVGTLIGCLVKDKYIVWKNNKEYIKKLKDDELDRKLRRVIKEELEPVKFSVEEIKLEEEKLKLSTTRLIKDKIDQLYEAAKLGDKEAVDKLLNTLNDPVAKEINDEIILEKINSIRGYYSLQYNNIVPATLNKKGKKLRLNDNNKNKR